MPGRSAGGVALAFLALGAGGVSCRAVSGASAGPPSGEAAAVRRPVEDVFLLTGELRAVRSISIVTPRGEGELQIRWMVDDGTEIGEGDRVVGYRLRQTDSKRRAIEALRGLQFRTIAAGDSYNDTAMLSAADAGILYRPPDKVALEFPQFPVTRSYDELRAAFERAAVGL